METLLNNFLFIGSVILLISIFLSKSSSRFGLPILVLFLFVGMVAGSEGIGGIYFENYELTHTLSLIALCLIIFSGGIDTNLHEVKNHLIRGITLSSFGVLLTAITIGSFTYYVTSLTLSESLLLGAILSATDAAAVFSILQDKKTQVESSLKNLLKFESGSNDPMAYFLVSLIIGYIEFGIKDYADLSLMTILNPAIGLLGGWLISYLFLKINNKINLDHLGLYPALTLAFLFLSYSAVTILKGNGFLAVYVFGLLIGNKNIIHKNILLTFYDGISWLSQIGLFVMLGLLVFPSRLVSVAIPALMIALFLIFIARPFVVFLCLIKSRFKLREKVFISWAGLKGATPIVFASFAATHIGEKANIIFDIVFFVVLISALLQGSTLRILGAKFKLLVENTEDEGFPINFELLGKTKKGHCEIKINPNCPAIGKKIVELNLPYEARVLFIKREGTFIIPDGSSIFQPGDLALIVTKELEEIEVIRKIF